MLCTCWIVLLFEACIISDLVIDDYEAQDGATTPSFASLGRRAFGDVGGTAISVTFLVLMMATLVSQLAKASTLVTIGPSALRIIGLAVGLSAFASRAPLRTVSSLNGVLTFGFVAAVGVLFREALPAAEVARLGHADWARCAASVPTLLQLHVYAEVVPSVCEALQYSRRRVRRALVLGSALLLCVQLGWSTLGIAAVPSDALSGGLRIDPVESLLQRGGALGAATAIAGITAVSTTVIGTARALYTFCVDACQPATSDPAIIDTATTIDTASTSPPMIALKEEEEVWWRARPALAFAACIGVPTLIACTARATSLFFGAIDFAGAYPVALLWGLAPPLMRLRLGPQTRDQDSSRRRVGLLVLAAIAAAFVATNLVSDVAAVFGSGAVARWQ